MIVPKCMLVFKEMGTVLIQWVICLWMYLKNINPMLLFICVQRHCTFFIRLPWQFVCKLVVKFNQANEDFKKRLFYLCSYDVFPLTIIVVIAYWFDFNVELLLLSIITIAVIALVLKFYDKRKFSKKTQIVYFVSNTVILVIMGFWVSLGCNENVTMALTFARFMMVAGPIALLFKCSKLFYLPTAVIVVEKLLYGNFSTLDAIFIPCNFLISAVFALAMARINRA